MEYCSGGKFKVISLYILIKYQFLYAHYKDNFLIIYTYLNLNVNDGLSNYRQSFHWKLLLIQLYNVYNIQYMYIIIIYIKL